MAVEQASGYGWTVAAWLEAWLARQLPYLRVTTAASYGQHIRDYLTPALGRIRLAELGLPAVQAIFWDLAAVDRRNGPLCPNSLQRVRATLRSALSDARRAGLIRENPASTVRIPGWRRGRPVVWTPALEAAWRDGGPRPWVAGWDLPHIHRFLDAARDDDLAALWWLVTLCGLRRGEVAGLCWRHLDLPGRQLHIQEQVIYLGARRISGPPKRACGQRSLALDDILLAMLAAHRERQRRRHGEWAVAAARPMFTRECGRPVRPDWLTRRFGRLVADLGLPPIRFHDLRRATATLGVAGDVPLRVMQYILGHADVATTADVYTVVPGQVGRDAMTAIAGVVAKATS